MGYMPVVDLFSDSTDNSHNLEEEKRHTHPAALSRHSGLKYEKKFQFSISRKKKFFFHEIRKIDPIFNFTKKIKFVFREIRKKIRVQETSNKINVFLTIFSPE